MTGKNIASFCLSSLKKHRAEKAQCVLTNTDRFQIKAEAGEMSLFRSSSDIELSLLAIKNSCQGKVSVNTDKKAGVEDAARRAIEAAKAAPPDEAYGVSEFQPEQAFCRGDSKPDLGGMHSRMSEFLREAKQYSGLRLAEASIGFSSQRRLFVNSNGVSLSSTIGVYDLDLAFSSYAGASASSVNFVSRTFGNLSRPLMECGDVSTLLRQSLESVGARPVSEKFLGDIIVSPDCLSSFLHFITEQALKDTKIMAGTSPYAGKLGTVVASAGFTLKSMPLAHEIASGYFITPDGYRARNITVVEEGVLKTYLLSRYGASKTGFGRAGNAGGGYVISPGHVSFTNLVGSIKRGLLVTRFSGGAPNQKGDFSGVAKNSFYIENGKIRFPVSETMISGNIPEMFMRIGGISNERISLGSAVYPWISFPGVNISGR